MGAKPTMATHFFHIFIIKQIIILVFFLGTTPLAAATVPRVF